MELKKIALTIGIAVLFSLFIVFLVDAVYEAPKYEDFCEFQYYGPRFTAPYESKNCTNVYDEPFFNDCIKSKGEVRYNYDEKGCETNPYCEYCGNEFNQAESKYNKNIFYISAIIGIIAILAGLYLPKSLDAIASGFIFGGIIILIQGTARVFGNLDKWTKVVVLGIELILLIWIGYKKVTEKKEENGRVKKGLHFK